MKISQLEEIQSAGLVNMTGVEVIEIIEEEEEFEEGEIIYTPEESIPCYTSTSESSEESPNNGTIASENFLTGDTILIPTREFKEIPEHLPTEETNDISEQAEVSSRIADLASNFIELFPNPSSNILKVRSADIRIGNYTIHDAQGKVILKGVEAKLPLAIDVFKLCNGNYYFRLTSLDGIVHS